MSDRIVQRNLPNVFRLGAGYGVLASALASQLGALGRRSDAVQTAMLSSTFSGYGMYFGPTRFVEGRNIGTAAALTQVQDSAIRLVAPAAFSETDLRVGRRHLHWTKFEEEPLSGPASEEGADAAGIGDEPEPDFSTLQDTPTDTPTDVVSAEPSPQAGSSTQSE